MYQFKRQSDGSLCFNVETKKLRTTFNQEHITITCIEHLSNELFYEFFDYLDGCDIYKAFSNLNSRFQHLITYSPFSLKIKLSSKSESELKDCCKNIIIPNRHRVLSFYLEIDLLAHCIIDSSFTCLESIVINDISTSKLMMLLFYLKSLPRLFTLAITFDDTEWECDLNYIYSMIFSLPALKYTKLSLLTDEDLNISVPLAINQPFSTIEYLIIKHTCSLAELASLLPHTPRLRHLTCVNLAELDDHVKIEKSITLSNLTHITIDYPPSDFRNFEMFIQKLSAPVEVLRIIVYGQRDYLDADCWERLIIKHMHHLRRFKFVYHQYDWDDYEDGSVNEINKRFTSPFWIKRQWLFTAKIGGSEILFSVLPCRKTWLDFYECKEYGKYSNQNTSQILTQYVNFFDRQENGNSVDQCIPSIQLTINNCTSSRRNRPFIDKFKSIIGTVQFTHLNINCKEISIETLVRIIHLLPNLDSLKVLCLPFIESNWLLDQDADFRFLTSINNKITKVKLEKMIDIEQVHFILYLCLRIQYFQLDVPPDMDLEMVVRYILIKANTHVSQLSSLCLYIPNANDETVKKLQILIDTEKLLSSYIMKRICNNIVLKWN